MTTPIERDRRRPDFYPGTPLRLLDGAVLKHTAIVGSVGPEQKGCVVQVSGCHPRI